jgi:PAS domain S-box-containing protein
MDYNKLPIDLSLLMKSILENSSLTAVFILDEKGTLLATSPGTLKAFGYTEESLLGKNFELLFTEIDRNKNNPEKELNDVVKSGTHMDANFLVHKDGRAIWVHGESILAKNDLGRNYIVKIVYDIDEQRRLRETLTKVNHDLNNFVYAASHDLKGPINNIEALIYNLKEDPECTQKSADLLNMIIESIQKFKVMLHDLSEIGKVQEEGNNVTEIYFKEILKEILDNLNTQIKDSKAVIEFDFSKAPSMYYSKKNMRSIFYNLISNSIKFKSPERDPHIKISTEEVERNMILLKVKDNGIGIKEENKGKIFSLYERLNPGIEGTGVGMAILARIVDGNGGEIKIDSNFGQGSTFNIYLKDRTKVD